MALMDEQRAPSLISRLRRYFPNVDRVADATAPMRVEVTKEDVANAKKKDEKHCAMAVACEREKSVNGAIIKTTVAFLIKGTVAIRYAVPASVAREIVSFDRHGDFRPGEYQLSAMPKSHGIGYARGGGVGRSKKSKGLIKHLRPLVSRRTEGIRGVKSYDGV